MLAKLRDPSDRLLAALLLAPAFALLALIVVYPIGKLIFNSFFDLRLQGGGHAPFVGLDNYALVLKDKDFWNATWNTVLITLVTVPGALIMGLVHEVFPDETFHADVQAYAERLAARPATQSAPAREVHGVTRPPIPIPVVDPDTTIRLPSRAPVMVIIGRTGATGVTVSDGSDDGDQPAPVRA